MMNNHDFDLNELPPEHEQPPVEQPELSYSQRLEAAQTRRFEQKELLAKSVALSEILKKYPRKFCFCHTSFRQFCFGR